MVPTVPSQNLLRRTVFQSTISFVLSLLLLFGNTAKEFVHQFAGHTDTVHCNHGKGELSFETQHHHCDFLSYVLPDFQLPEPLVIYSTEATLQHFPNPVPVPEHLWLTRCFSFISGRGPPQAFIA